MAANSNVFMSHLKESGLLGAEQLAEVRDRIDAVSVNDCISGMVQRGWLTEFQVKQLHAGQSKGLVLGQYHILDELGRGGYGCVYKARHKLMDRVVALKVIAPELVADTRARTWFRREVFAATQLNHPNICMAYDADEVDEILFFAMEFVDGMNLESLVRKRGALPIGMACELMSQTAKALQYAHEKGMVHRDIKPANMLIPRDAIAETSGDPSGSSPVMVKVVDFGLARLQKSSPHQTLFLQSEKSFVGTPAFVSPEQARNVHDVDIRSDLYSLGCTLYFALAGRPPFAGESVFELLAHHLESEPEPIEHRRREIPPALASIVRRLMAKKPEKRFQTPAELISEMGFFFSTDRSNLNRPAPVFVPVAQLRSEATPEPLSSFVGSVTQNQATDVKADVPCPTHAYPQTAIVDYDSAQHAPGLIQTNMPLAAGSQTNATVIELENQGGATPVIDATEVCELEPAPVEPGTLAIDDSLVESWMLWSSVIESLARGQHPEVSDSAYRDLHKRLLEQCRFHAARSAVEIKPLFQQMIDVVQPWLSLSAIPIGDRPAMASLFVKCRRISEALGVTERKDWQWAIGFIILAVAAALGWIVFQELPSIRTASLLRPQTLIQENTYVFLAALVVPMLVAIVFFLVRRMRRV